MCSHELSAILAQVDAKLWDYMGDASDMCHKFILQVEVFLTQAHMYCIIKNRPTTVLQLVFLKIT